MASYINALRVVAAIYAKRTITLIAWIGLAVFVLLTTATWQLATHYSSYWWLALIFIVPMGFIGLVAFIISRTVANVVQGQKLTRSQKKRVNAFVDKVQSVVEATQLSFFFIIVMLAKDLLLHRNLQTLERFIGESTTLRRDLDDLAQKL